MKGKKRLFALGLVLAMLLSFIPVIGADADDTVYYTSTGKKFHYSRSCSGLSRAKNVYSTSLSTARSMGLAACAICSGGTAGGGSSSGGGGGSTVTPEPPQNPIPVIIPTIPVADTINTDPSQANMFRLFNPNSGEHFYTASSVEGNNLLALGWNYEGIAWKAPVSSNTPVYRLYNPNSGEHHYTAGVDERDFLVSLGWNFEGIGWYSSDLHTTPMHRLYNPNATGQFAAGAHFYTNNVGERDVLVSNGWTYEGIGWYGI